MELTGYNFDVLPQGVLAFLANSNDDPTRNLGSTSNSFIMDIEVTSVNTATATARSTGAHSSPYYIGVIASADGSTVYWVNNTRPLP